MNAPTYHVGETVDVTIRDARIIEVGTIFIEVELSAERQMFIEFSDKAIEVVRRVPADGMPQPGDVWKDCNGTLWFASRHFPDYDDREDCKGINDDGWRAVLVPDSVGEQGSPKRPEDVNQTYGPLSLVFRPEPRKAAQEVAF